MIEQISTVFVVSIWYRMEIIRYLCSGGKMSHFVDINIVNK